MQGIVRVCWTVSPLETPRIWQNCSRCGTRTPFVCSGKFRVNAQGKRIDAWLIYRCIQCDQTWNCPVLERRSVAEVDPSHLQALTENCGLLAKRHAFDLARLRRYSDRIEEGDGVTVHACLLSPCDGAPKTLVVSIAAPLSCRIRLDRLLAGGLGLSRGTVQRLHDAAALGVSPPSRAALRQPIRDGQTITIDLRSAGSTSERLSATLLSEPGRWCDASKQALLAMP